MRFVTINANRRRLSMAAGIAAVLCVSSPSWAQTVGNAASFAIVGGQAVAANGAGSIVTGNVGISPAAGTFITGFPGSAIVVPPFSVRGNDATAIAAEADADALFNSAAMGLGGVLVGDALSTSGPGVPGHYVPGKYQVAGIATITTSITLDGAGLYIFTLPTALTTSVGSTIILNGADPCNVWWRVPTQATLDGANFVGTVVSNALIALGTNATVTGRALTTANGSVTLAGNDRIGGCSGAAAVPVPPPVASGSCPVVAPTITSVPNQVIPVSGSVAVNFSISGAVIPYSLGVTATSSDLTLVPQSAMVITSGGGGARVLTVSGADGRSGVATITLTVTDPNSACTTTTSFLITIGAVAVPTLPQWAFLALAVLMGLTGFAAMRRRGAN